MDKINIVDELQENFLISSVETNVNRAFPSALDGLKPSMRACLWEMYTKKYFSSKPHVKSAKVSGGVIASWSPHGDVATYETFARMSQPFVNNNPEVDFHGANGNLIVGKEGVANQRYTEVRLSPISEKGLLWGIEKNAVDFQPNFSEDLEWPKVFPSFFPRLLVNGAQGIGVGIANYWVTHNLKDVVDGLIHYIETDETDNSLRPSFPTGGTIINTSELSKINETGKGRVILRGKVQVKGREIFITELPYQVYVKDFVEEVIKKIQEGKLTNISDISDRSDLNHLCVVVECMSSAYADKVLQSLYEQTSLQTQINVNQIAIVNNTPKLLTLSQMYGILVKHNGEVLVRVAKFDIDALEKELFKLYTIRKALENIDEVVHILKDIDQEKQAAIFKEKLDFSEEQIEIVTRMRLGSLKKMNVDKLNSDIEIKETKLAELREFVESPELQKKELINRFAAIRDEFATKNKTEYIDVEIAKKKRGQKKEETVSKVAIVIDNNNYIKSLPAGSFRKNKSVAHSLILNSNELVYIFTSLGRLYRIKADKIKQLPKGTPIVNVVSMQPDEKVLLLTNSQNLDNCHLTICSRYAIIKKIKGEDCVSNVQSLKGLVYTKLADGDSVIFVEPTNGERIVIGDDKHIIALSLDDIPTMGRTAKGRKAMRNCGKVVIVGYDKDIPADIRPKKTSSIGSTGNKWNGEIN